MTKKVALVTGVGPGTGSAIVRRFAEGLCLSETHTRIY